MGFFSDFSDAALGGSGKSSEKAAERMQKAYREASQLTGEKEGEIREHIDERRDDISPLRRSYLDILGAGGVEAQQKAYDTFLDDPVQAGIRSQSQDIFARQAGARGNLASGNALIGLRDLNAGLVQGYKNELGGFYQDYEGLSQMFDESTRLQYQQQNQFNLGKYEAYAAEDLARGARYTAYDASVRRIGQAIFQGVSGDFGGMANTIGTKGGTINSPQSSGGQGGGGGGGGMGGLMSMFGGGGGGMGGMGNIFGGGVSGGGGMGSLNSGFGGFA